MRLGEHSHNNDAVNTDSVLLSSLRANRNATTNAGNVKNKVISLKINS